MKIRTLYLRDFRNYKETYFEFSPYQNILFGNNAQGKTNVLEAIYYLMTGRSFRTSNISDLIQKDADAFYLEATFEKRGISQTIKISCSKKEKKILYNQTSMTSFAGIIGLIPGTALTPDDIGLVKGAPTGRRQLLDLLIAQCDPLYVHHLGRYSRAMRHRNYLLKARSVVAIESWEHEMAMSAAYLASQRIETIKALNHCIQAFHPHLSGAHDSLEINYKGTSENGKILPESFLSKWKSMRQREMLQGMTLSGPHRDDVEILIEGHPARYFASEGQQRTCVASLRLAEWKRLSEQADAVPLIMIDDVGVSLDFSRRERLLGALKTMGQVFLTATSDLSSHFEPEKIKSFQIEKAKIFS